mmetsp:Transcript_31143/g.61158  ORF Transcript_31143/g.61158 Transcript_31143/m.61158 type:complete len:209 (+) Transcript_31143:405-1031(+)
MAASLFAPNVDAPGLHSIWAKQILQVKRGALLSARLQLLRPSPMARIQLALVGLAPMPTPIIQCLPVVLRSHGTEIGIVLTQHARTTQATLYTPVRQSAPYVGWRNLKTQKCRMCLLRQRPHLRRLCGFPFAWPNSLHQSPHHRPPTAIRHQKQRDERRGQAIGIAQIRDARISQTMSSTAARRIALCAMRRGHFRASPQLPLLARWI